MKFADHHVHDYDADWRCGCGFMLPERFRPRVQGAVDQYVQYVSFLAWAERMKEYERPETAAAKGLRRTTEVEAPA
jgi:hypothetical protein